VRWNFPSGFKHTFSGPVERQFGRRWREREFKEISTKSFCTIHSLFFLPFASFEDLGDKYLHPFF